ncbi:hypothetical protein EUTSA_v10028014mg [Eutrema salsugineum]|uniref:Uncharacterized protein n=1 Tax=Eutrema salsugineum TaxID=72664 RepID=V4LW66_EUTSA|nr:hypothetical protein EUTSA_v10028014mg [Eutrema salsugineum]
MFSLSLSPSSWRFINFTVIIMTSPPESISRPGWCFVSSDANGPTNILIAGISTPSDEGSVPVAFSSPEKIMSLP